MPEQLRPESKDLGEAATFISNSSFLISHSGRAFARNPWTPQGLTLNPTAYIFSCRHFTPIYIQ